MIKLNLPKKKFNNPHSKIFSFYFTFNIYQTKITKILADKYNGIRDLELKKMVVGMIRYQDQKKKKVL